METRRMYDADSISDRELLILMNQKLDGLSYHIFGGGPNNTKGLTTRVETLENMVLKAMGGMGVVLFILTCLKLVFGK